MLFLLAQSRYPRYLKTEYGNLFFAHLRKKLPTEFAPQVKAKGQKKKRI
jgi:hypothetical protein